MDQNTLLSHEIIQYMVNYTSYFIFSFIGSTLKEINNTNNDVEHDFDPYRVVTSTLVASLCALAVKEYFKETLDQYWGIMGIISLILGFVGFEIFFHISSIRALNRFITNLRYGEVEPADEEINATNKKQHQNTTIQSKPDHMIDYHVQKPIIHHPNEHNRHDDDEDDEEEDKK